MSSDKLETKLQRLLEDPVLPRTSKRFNCPSCGGINTFSVTNLGTILLFHCFKASCKFRGKRATEISVTNLKEKFACTAESKQLAFDVDNFFFIPETLNRNIINNILHKYNCWEAYREGRADIRFDPKENRFVFIIYDSSTPVAAIGRKLLATIEGPKWKRYGKVSMPFICVADIESQTDTLIVVEDCCSACAASAYCDSAALLGTYLPASYIKEFLKYDKFILALDQDASKLAIKMQKDLQYYRPTKIMLLTEDLKSFNTSEIKRLFNV